MAVKMQAEYGDALNTVFVEVQGASADDVEKFALEKKWLGTDAMWTTERPLITGASGIPNCVLLSSEGEVVLMGHPMALHKQIEEHIAQSGKRADAPADLPRELSTAWKSYARGKLGDAILAAEAVVARSADDVELATAAEKLAGLARQAADARLQRIDRLIEEGAYERADDLASDLAKDLGRADTQRVQERIDRLASQELADEVAAEKAFRKIEAKLYADGPDDAAARRLEKLVKKHAGTKAAARAEHLLGLMR